MELCWSCQAAVEPGRSHCKVCDAEQRARPDATLVQAPPPTHPPGPPPPPAPTSAPPGYGPPAPGYGPPGAPGPYGYSGPYGYGAVPVYGAPAYMVPPAYVVPVAAPLKSKAVAALLCFFLGGLGIHRFYTGQVGLGLALLLTSLILGPLTLGLWYGVTLIWVLVDFVMILAGGVSDQYGRELV